MLYEGHPAFTQFSSSNGGYSSAGSQPYLAAQPDPLRSLLGQPQRPVDRHRHQLQIEKAWPVVSKLVSLSLSRDGLGGHFGGRVTSVTLTGSLGGLPTSVKVTGDDFRSRLELKSTWLELAPA